MATENGAYPLSLRGEMTSPPSRGWWLLKWLLGLPHYIILAFLWIAFLVVWVISLFAILFTGRHPKGLFDFKVGVLRWTWRVGFYSYEALGTDKYPPFTLQPAAGYPADLEIPYLEKPSRGLALVKWWLLAIPHYIVISAFYGIKLGWEAGKWDWGTGGAGLLYALVIIAAIALLFTGKYHKDIFRLVVGLNRWAYRVCAYASLLTDAYPPFRLWDD